MHFELPETRSFEIEYPEEALHVWVLCPACGLTHTYAPQDVESKSSLEPLHYEGWRPLLPFPHPKTLEKLL